MVKSRSNFEIMLTNAFESGYSNAANSLSQLMMSKTHFDVSDHGFHELGSELFSDYDSANAKKEMRIVTTEIFGDIRGKSYLLLSDIDFHVLSAGIPEGKGRDVSFKAEFVKELDNILSASVITRLSNELKLKMYGDVPVLLENVTCKIGDMIYDDFAEESQKVYINSTFYYMDNYKQVSPFFVWVLDQRNLSSVEARIFG